MSDKSRKIIDNYVKKANKSYNKKIEKQNKKPSKLIKYTKASVSLFILGAGAVFTYPVFKETSDIKNGNYKTNEEILKDTQLFGAKTNPHQEIDFHYLLKHNGKKPIYVYIDPSLDDNAKKSIKFTLANLQSIFKDIDPRYKFEILESKEKFKREESIRNTVIYFGKTSFVSNNILARNTSNHAFLNYNIISRSTILINEKYMLDTTNYDILYLHEILHSFGFRDVYKGSSGINSHENTVMHVNKENAIITPNDYRMLHAMYNQKTKGEDTDYQEYEKINNLIDKYENAYFSLIVDKIKESDELSINKISKEEAEDLKLTAYFMFPLVNVGLQRIQQQVTLNKNNTAVLTLTNIDTNTLLVNKIIDYKLINGTIILPNYIVENKDLLEPNYYQLTQATSAIIYKEKDRYSIKNLLTLPKVLNQQEISFDDVLNYNNNNQNDLLTKLSPVKTKLTRFAQSEKIIYKHKNITILMPTGKDESYFNEEKQLSI